MSGPLGRRVHRHRRQIQRITASYGANNPRVFGSVARGDERPDSDIDVLVDLPTGMGLFTLGRMRRDLEELLGAAVDIVPADGLKPGVRAAVESQLLKL